MKGTRTRTRRTESELTRKTKLEHPPDQPSSKLPFLKRPHVHPGLPDGRLGQCVELDVHVLRRLDGWTSEADEVKDESS